MNERFVVILHSRTSECTFVNKARKKLFASEQQIENIPPAEDALIQHTKRAIYQGIHICNRILMPKQVVPMGMEEQRR